MVLWHCQSAPSTESTTGCGFATAAQSNAAAQASEAIEIAKTLCSPHALVIGGTPDEARSIGPALRIACEALHNFKAGFFRPDRHFREDRQAAPRLAAGLFRHHAVDECR
jgi:hypothetical protein